MAETKALIAARVARLVAEFGAEPYALYRAEEHHWASVGELRRVLDGALTGVDADVPVALVLRQRPSCLAAAIALWGSGRCVDVLSPLRPDRAIADDIRTLAPSVVVAERDDWDRDGFADAAAGAIAVELQTRPSAAPAVVRARPERARVAVRARMHHAATVTTSGTTGAPKRYALSWDDLTAGIVAREPSRDRGVIINALPLFSIGGVRAMAMTILGGRPIALMERFDVIEWASLIRDHRPRRAGAPPAVLRMVLDAQVPREWLRSVRSLYTASAPLPIDLADEFESAYGIPIVQGYGATEFLGGVTGWPGDLHARWGVTKRGSVGRPLPGVSVRVVDRVTREPVGVDEVGNLEVDSSYRAEGVPEGWVATNDLARIDEDGFVWILGRSDDVIIRGGFKISLPEVEAVLRQHPGVRDACVVGVADERVGEVPAALVVPDGASVPSEDELIELVRQQLPPYSAPAVVATCDAIPLNAMLKRDRVVITSMLNEELANRRQSA